MDLTLALLPWTLVWKLQMKPAEKIGVAVAMSMGILCVWCPSPGGYRSTNLSASAGVTALIKTSKIPSGMSSMDMCKLPRLRPPPAGH